MKLRRVAHKYGAKKTQLDGITFDSKAEAARYAELKMLESTGHITQLKLQPAFELVPSVKYSSSSRATPPMRYIADFTYVDHLGNVVVEDVKGVRTREYLMKKHLMKFVHGIEISEVRKR